jgi:hypothetical protein
MGKEARNYARTLKLEMPKLGVVKPCESTIEDLNSSNNLLVSFGLFLLFQQSLQLLSVKAEENSKTTFRICFICD